MTLHLHQDKSFAHLISAYLIAILGAGLAIGLAFTVMFLPHELEALLLSPLVHELAKPAGVLWVLERRPLWFHRRGHVVGACLAAGVAFGILESLAWVWVKHVEGVAGADLFSWRCAVSMVMQVVAAGLLSIGLAISYRPGHKHGLVEVRKLAPYYAGAVGLHIAVNGVMRFMIVLTVFSPNYL